MSAVLHVPQIPGGLKLHRFPLYSEHRQRDASSNMLKSEHIRGFNGGFSSEADILPDLI